MLKDINKINNKKQRFYLFFHLEEEKKKSKIYVDNWLSTVFLQKNIQSIIIYKVKINNIKKDTVVNVVANCVTYTACLALCQKLEYTIA